MEMGKARPSDKLLLPKRRAVVRNNDDDDDDIVDDGHHTVTLKVIASVRAEARCRQRRTPRPKRHCSQRDD